jgi:DNA-binding response OmpR family regulator
LAGAEQFASGGSALVVDDEDEHRESIRRVLEQRFRVMTAESGEQAVDVLRHHQVDAVTVDLTMTDLNGIEVFRQIQALDPHVAIIIVSSVDPTEVPRGLPLGATGWIAKPFAVEQLLDAV